MQIKLREYKEVEQKLYIARLNKERSEENYKTIINGTQNYDASYSEYKETIKEMENLLELANEEIKRKFTLINERAHLILNNGEARREFTNDELEELALIATKTRSTLK